MEERREHNTSGLVDELKARLRYAHRLAMLESLDILERRISELYPEPSEPYPRRAA